jgi:hypothetical protein
MHLKTRLTAKIVPPAEDITDSAETTAVKSSRTNQFYMNSPKNRRCWTKRRKRKLLRLKCVFVDAYHWIPATVSWSMNALS